MMSIDRRVAVLLACLAAAPACGRPPDAAGSANAATAAQTSPETTAATSAEPPAPATATASGGGVFTGNVVETMNAGGYTYLRLRNESGETWIAAPEFDAKTGEPISAALDMPMHDFHSRTLDRSFPLIYFVQEIGRNGQPVAGGTQAAPPSLMNSHGAASTAPAVRKLDPPAGGLSVASVFARKAELSGKTLTVRGTVVKFNGGIMDRNWFHIQDGSGSPDTHDNDLTVTSNAPVKVGDIVTVSGVLGTGRDFGAGYAYDAILERASITGH